MYRCRRYGTLVCCILIGFKPGATAKEIRLVGHIPSGEYMRIAGPALLIDDDPVANRQTGIACQIDRRNNAAAHHNRVASNLSSVRQLHRRDPPTLAAHPPTDPHPKTPK